MYASKRGNNEIAFGLLSRYSRDFRERLHTVHRAVIVIPVGRNFLRTLYRRFVDGRSFLLGRERRRRLGCRSRIGGLPSGLSAALARLKIARQQCFVLKNDKSLDDVFELPDVARPAVVLQCFAERRGQRGGWLTFAVSCATPSR